MLVYGTNNGRYSAFHHVNFNLFDGPLGVDERSCTHMHQPVHRASTHHELARNEQQSTVAPELHELCCSISRSQHKQCMCRSGASKRETK
jgi:hypothetical protein